MIYIANLIALEQWYDHVRSLFIADDFPEPLFQGLKAKLNMAIKERLKRFQELSQKMPESINMYQSFVKENASRQLLQQKNELYNCWPELEESCNSARQNQEPSELQDLFLEKIHTGITSSGKDYIAVIKNLDAADAAIGTRWLQDIVDAIVSEALKILPSFHQGE